MAARRRSIESLFVELLDHAAAQKLSSRRFLIALQAVLGVHRPELSRQISALLLANVHEDMKP